MTAVARRLNAALFHPRYWLLWLGLLLLRLVVQLPFTWLMALGAGLGRLAMPLMGARVRIARRNLALALPELDEAAREALLKENFANVGRAILETGMAWYWSDGRMRRWMQVEGLEHLQAAQQQGQGILLLSAHFLTLELNARMIGLVRPAVGVYRPNRNPVLEYAQVTGRCRSNKAMLDRKDVKGMVKTLRAGDALWYAPDHDYGPHASVFVPFFAVAQAATITGTATLARVKNTVVVPCFTLRQPQGGYRLVLGAPLADYPSGDDQADAAASNRVIEAAIRQAPAQYMWLHRRFKTTPPGVPYRY
ncbi:MAG: LpxL/LpxP family Kdo(2)-lipid IV(A) lauroyl/palmitoleoyl acyltransferase [Aeromonadaceae bacterium]|nr:LpxL/LpxP family Kdo(2)-lipid IV(A) lauroyl/palmitoleoyl acyltransferase [Aeromonadaceae bacterium]